MKDKEYNLLDEPWIRVIDEDCGIHEVSLIKLFEQAHIYRDLCGELPTQDFAMLRLLLAVLHTVFSRYDVSGNSRPLADADDALDRWEELWKNKKFPAEVITRYLESQRENFYLFHQERPFYQCEHAKRGTAYLTSKLNGNLSESSNKLRLFTNISGKAKEEMDFSEAARWLLYVNAFDDTSAKPSRESKEFENKLPSVGAGWLGKLGIIFLAGNNLFETLMLNLVMINEKRELFANETPIWEQDIISDKERNEIRHPDSLSKLYTLQSRRLFLNRKGDVVTGYFLLGGDFFDKENAFIEPMTIWKKADKKRPNSCVPRRHDCSIQFWRECSAALMGDEERQPGVISWVKYLEEEKLVKGPYINVRMVSVQYGDKDFFVTNVFSDSLQLHASLISDMNVQWRAVVLDSIQFCDKISKKVWMLAKEINLASGGSNSTKESKGTAAFSADKAKVDFYSRIDRPFRKWLWMLNPDMDNAREKEEEWRKECVGIAKQLGNELVRHASPIVIFGRRKNNSDERSNKKEETFSAAVAMNKFLFSLKNAEKL